MLTEGERSRKLEVCHVCRLFFFVDFLFSSLPTLFSSSLLLCVLAVFVQGFEINDQTGRPLTDKDMMNRHHSRVHELQKLVFEHYREALPEFPFVSSAAAGKVQRYFDVDP